jgi:hypothetical protein
MDYEMDVLKKQVDQLKRENEWLQQEAEKTRLENQDYQTFVSRRAQKRQSLVVSLGDQNRIELEKIREQKEQLVKQFERKKMELNTTLLEKQNELSKVNQELIALQPYRTLQKEQEEEITALEKEVEEKRFLHENRIRVLKTQFLREQKSFEKEAELRVRMMAERADKRASQCLKEQSQRISTENKQLRAKLQELIEKNNSLQVKKMQLDKQYHKLLEEQKFIRELQKIRGLSTFESNSELALDQHSANMQTILQK